MDVDAATAAALGWPKLKYAVVERERRWLCPAVPHGRVIRAERFTDLYITGTRLRLREAAPVGGGATMRRLGRKADVGCDTRLITSVYLSAVEFELLAGLPGHRLHKTRHHLGLVAGVELSVDSFEGDLAGLCLAEAEFADDEAMRAYPMPDFCTAEVTDDPRYRGGDLVANGLPAGFAS